MSQFHNINDTKYKNNRGLLLNLLTVWTEASTSACYSTVMKCHSRTSVRSLQSFLIVTVDNCQSQQIN